MKKEVIIKISGEFSKKELKNIPTTGEIAARIQEAFHVRGSAVKIEFLKK